MRTASSKSPKLGQEAKSMLEKSMGSIGDRDGVT